MKYRLGPAIEVERAKDPTWERVGSAVALVLAEQMGTDSELSVVRARAADGGCVPFMAEVRWSHGVERHVVLRAELVPADRGRDGLSAWLRRVARAGAGRPSLPALAAVARYFRVIPDRWLRQLEGLPCAAEDRATRDERGEDGRGDVILTRLEHGPLPAEVAAEVQASGFNPLPVLVRRTLRLGFDGEGVEIDEL